MFYGDIVERSGGEAKRWKGIGTERYEAVWLYENENVEESSEV